MDSTIVVKVKYGDTLRRFNARIVNEELALNMNELREKIISLFNFPSDSDITLTYIDEDGDVVTMADEEDLHDVMRQSLNPLRMSVRLNTEKSVKSYSRSSSSSTLMRSPRVQPSLRNLNGTVSEILKAIPEAILQKLTRLPAELGNDTTPGHAELLDSLSKLGLNYLKEVVSNKAESSENIPDTLVNKDESDAKVDVATQVSKSKGNEASVTKDENSSTCNLATQVSKSNASTATEENFSGLLGRFVNPEADMVDLNSAPRGDHFAIGSSYTNSVPSSFGLAGDRNKDAFVERNVEGNINGGVSQGARVATSSPFGDKMKEIKKTNESILGLKSVGAGLSSANVFPNLGSVDSPASDHGVTGTKPVNVNSWNPLGYQYPLNSFVECPFAGVQIENHSSSVAGGPFAPRAVPFKRSHNHNDGIGSIFHRGVRCDGCGVHPITGPRFKSKVKEDYDLCSICFAEKGNDTDYIRMDRPINYRHLMKLLPGRPPLLPHGSRGSSSRSKLDSRFIQDVSILDGTIMAPSTPFTKIWRLRNNGSVAWPHGSQLLWIGGDRFSKTLSADLEMSADSCPVDKELDIAVDFIAPQNPGRYVSYWRMASPSGQKFGQRVWVLIQVDASLKDSFSENVHGFNLNLPPFSSGIMGSQIENVNVEPMAKDGLPKIDSTERDTELLETAIDASTNKEQELNFPINDTLIVGGAASNPGSVDAVSTVVYTNPDFSEATSLAENSNTNVLPSVEGGVNNQDEVEQALLKELEEMGFKQVDLNKEILRMNEYNLEQSVDELCGVAEWDPILEELQEMGFSDKETNKMLLRKNNGSIKRVVMDLIAGERTEKWLKHSP